MHCAGIEYVWIWPLCAFVFCSIYLSIYTQRLWNEPIIFPHGIFKNLKERDLLTSFSACAFMYCVELASLQWVVKHLLSEKKRMSYLSAALPSSIYISRGFIYNSGNSLIYCKTKKKKTLPPYGLTSSMPCFVLQVEYVLGSLGNWGQKERKYEEEEWAELAIP